MELLKQKIEAVENFPKDGVTFRDITPILSDFLLFNDAVIELSRMANDIDGNVDKVVGIESRGFILGSVIALSLEAGFVPVRKCVGTKSKLPRAVYSAECTLEYGTAILDIHKDGVKPGEQVVIIDDVLATGGTAKAAAELVEKCGGIVAKIVFLVEIEGLNGREKLKGYNVDSLIQF